MKKIRAKLSVLFLLLTGIPILVLIYLGTEFSRQALQDEVVTSLNAIVDQKIAQIDAYVETEKNDISVLSQTPSVIEAFRLLSTTFAKGIDSDAYLSADSMIRPFLSQFKETGGYNNLYLIALNGDILFSVIHEEVFASNLITGPYKNSQLANNFDHALTTQKTGIYAFTRLASSTDKYQAYVSTPVFKDGKPVGVVVLQLDTLTLYGMASEYQGRGKTGEIMLARQIGNEAIIVAPLRHDAKAAFSRRIVIGSEKGVPIQKAILGEAGAGISVDYRGREVVAAWRFMPGLKWGVVAKIDTKEVFQATVVQQRFSLLIGSVTFAIAALVAIFFSTRISRPLVEMARATTAIAGGDLSQRVKVSSGDELGKLASSVNTMSENLREANRQREHQLWVTTSMAELNLSMKGSASLQELSRNVLEQLCQQLDIQFGSLYVMEQGVLKLAGTSTPQDSVPQTWRLGEGLVGRAAAEEQLILVNRNNVPQDYVRIASSVGDSIPRNLAVIPVAYDGEVRGVIELGSFSKFTDTQIELLNGIGESIGQSIFAEQSDESHARIEALLTESRAQAVELESQSEELKQSNEELEEQTQLLEQERENVAAQNREIAHAQEELQERANELAQASQYKSDFLASMSHELRTPLNSLLILSKLLSENRDKNLTSKQVEYAMSIHDSGAELLSLIDEILDLARVESGKMAVNIADFPTIDLETYLKRTFGPMAEERGLEFKVSLSPDLPPVIRSDLQRLQQVLKNLISNALKFTEVGEISFDARPASTGFTPGHPVLESADQVIALSVRDTGVGISENKKQIIFEAFQQIDTGTGRKYGGTGLGLFISKEIAGLLGGEISLVSTPGEGSTFTFYLPASYEGGANEPTFEPVSRIPLQPSAQLSSPDNTFLSELPPEVIPDDRADLKPGDRVLLVIEDDLEFARILQDMAFERGFKVLVASEGMSGWALAKQLGPDAISLDIRLPDMSGWTVLDRLKHDPETRHIPVHIISADEQVVRGGEQGALTCVHKPVNAKKLAEALDAIGSFIDRKVKQLLVVEDDESERNSIVELIGNGDVVTTAVGTAKEALAILEKNEFDCIVLDLGLPDMNGFDLIDEIQKGDRNRVLPIIVYTGKDLTREEQHRLQKTTDTVIVKDARSPERLMAETALFLHRVEARLPKDKQRMIRQVCEHDDAMAGKKALIVDDDMRNIFALSSTLESHGMEIAYAENGIDAVELVKNSGGEFCVILMDIMMPGMDGYETIKEIRKLPEFAKIPIIAVTAKVMKGDRSKCIEAGASDYIAKPVDTDQLLSLLRVWLYESPAGSKSA
jgi:CheY-like chemotaxis protein/signal transduction histidine kinase/HAMP domain-containing protein